MNALFSLVLPLALASALAVPDSATVAPGRSLALPSSTADLTWRLVANRSGGRIESGVYAAGRRDFVTDVLEARSARGETATLRVLVTPGFSAEPFLVSTRTATARQFRVLPPGTPVRFRLDRSSGSGGRITETGAYHAGLRGDTVDWVLAEDSTGRVSVARVEILADEVTEEPAGRTPELQEISWFLRAWSALFGASPTRADYHDFLAGQAAGETRHGVVAGWLRDPRVAVPSVVGLWRGVNGTPPPSPMLSSLVPLYLDSGIAEVFVRATCDTAFVARARAQSGSADEAAWILRVQDAIGGWSDTGGANRLAAAMANGMSREAAVRAVLRDPILRERVARRLCRRYLGLAASEEPPARLIARFLDGLSFEALTVEAICSPEFRGISLRE